MNPPHCNSSDFFEEQVVSFVCSIPILSVVGCLTVLIGLARKAEVVSSVHTASEVNCDRQTDGTTENTIFLYREDNNESNLSKEVLCDCCFYAVCYFLYRWQDICPLKIEGLFSILCTHALSSCFLAGLDLPYVVRLSLPWYAPCTHLSAPLGRPSDRPANLSLYKKNFNEMSSENHRGVNNSVLQSDQIDSVFSF